MKLAISEVFYSIQGEGMTVGYPSVFVRLGGCNLMCGGMGTQNDGELHNATWRCDTIEVWMKSQSKDVSDVLNDECINALKKGSHLIITGGEPLMQQEGMIDFIQHIDKTIPNVYIEIETNGTIEPANFLQRRINQWNCSPKLANSGNSKYIYFNQNVIEVVNKLHTQFKFVVSSEEDWQEIQVTYLKHIDKDKVWLMPSGENQSLLNQTKGLVADICKREYLKFTSRLHIEIWDKKTGV